MKKILITGNSGYIGSHLTKFLSHNENFEVYGLDKNDCIVPVKEFYKIDINKRFTIPTEFDVIVHLAALVNVGESEQNSINYYITNVNGTMNILANIKTKNFIFASTGAAEYCQSAYGVSKRSAEYIVREYCTTHAKIPYTIFRFYNVIGTDGIPPTNPDGLFYKLIEATKTREFTIFGNDYENSPDGTCIRDYIHVNEVCNAIYEAVSKPSNSIECLGHGVGYTVKEIVNLFQKVNDVDFTVKYGPRRSGDLPVSVLENPSMYMKHLYSIEELLKI